MDKQGVETEAYRMLKKVGHFQSGIWSVEKEHNKQAKWVSDLKGEMMKLEQQNAVIN